MESEALPISFDAFAEGLGKLVRKFEAEKPHYLSKQYSEAQARVDFITPFFKALGWDVQNEARQDDSHPDHVIHLRPLSLYILLRSGPACLIPERFGSSSLV